MMKNAILALITGTLIAGAATAIPPQVDTSSRSAVPDAQDHPSADPSENAVTRSDFDTAPQTPDGSQLHLTVKGKRIDPLPALEEDRWLDCMAKGPPGTEQMGWCQRQYHQDIKVVVLACANHDRKIPPARVMQACTELLDKKLFIGPDRAFPYANRAWAHLALNDDVQGMEDLDRAIKAAPHNANLYYDRGLCSAAKSDADAAQRDFTAALSLDGKLVPALQQRAKLYLNEGNFSGAISDYSEAIRLQPNSAAAWSARGYVYIKTRDYEKAVGDETHAISLDPKLAQALFLRGAAFGDLGDSLHASDDIKSAVDIDPLLVRYVAIQGKNASLQLPPL
jgi:tetratricopeptide (TPR) repeat protein